MNTLDLIGRKNSLFVNDIKYLEREVKDIICNSRFLIIGGAGTIGQAVTKEIFKRNPLILHVVDISENNIVELVRDLRSSYGYIKGDFRTFCIDCGSTEFENFMSVYNKYDYILNLSALKHVRSERDPFTIMRLIEINIFNTIKTIELAKKYSIKKYFSVSSDKATNPTNLMGASKAIMEMFIFNESNSIETSTARFANVAFSDGSLLYGFKNRIEKKQPITAPVDIQRYFMTTEESGQLCLLSCLFGKNREIFFPKLNKNLKLQPLSKIAKKYIKSLGYKVYVCKDEKTARAESLDLIKENKWPCYFFNSDTSGEKQFEEFFSNNDIVILNRYKDIGIIKSDKKVNKKKLLKFIYDIDLIKSGQIRDKNKIIKIFKKLIPDFNHIETGKNLDNRM